MTGLLVIGVGNRLRRDDGVGLDVAGQLDSRQVAHLYDWPQILAVAKELYGHAPETRVLEVGGRDFALGEGLSEGCRRNGEAALGVLTA